MLVEQKKNFSITTDCHLPNLPEDGAHDHVIKTHLKKLFQNHIYCLPISKQGTAAHLLFLHVSPGEARYYFFVHEGWSWDLASIPKSSYSCHGWKIVWKITSSLHWLQHIFGLIWDAVFSLQPCHEWNYFSGLIQQVLYHSPLLLHHHLQLAPGTLFIEAAFVWLRLLPHTGTQAVYIPLTFKVTVVIVQEFPCWT